MAAKQQTFARNARELARYFYADMAERPRLFKRQIGVCAEWAKDASFPKKTPKGWKLEEVRQWNVRRYSEAQANLAAEQLAKPDAELPGVEPSDADLVKLLDRYQDMMFRPEAYEDKIAVWQVRMLEKHRPQLFEGDQKILTAENAENAKNGIVPVVDAADTLRDGSGRLKDCESQKALAMRLALVFAGRTSIDISEQQISKWKSDPASLPAGCPPPPPKMGNRFETQLWSEWFEKFMLPHYGYNSAQGVMKGLLAQAADARAEKEIDDARLKRMELDAALAKYVLRSDAEAQSVGDLQLLLNLFRRSAEVDAVRTRREFMSEKFSARLTAGEMAAIHAFDLESEQARVRAVEDEVCRMALAAPDIIKKMAEELSQQFGQ